MIWELEKPGRAKKLRRFHHNHRIVEKRAKQRRSWNSSDGWIVIKDHGTWKIVFVQHEHGYRWFYPFSERNSPDFICGGISDVWKSYPNAWIKNDNNCNGRRCRCHRKGWYKHPCSERPWGHRKGWNKFKYREWKFHEDVSNDWINEIWTYTHITPNVVRRWALFFVDDYEYPDPIKLQ